MGRETWPATTNASRPDPRDRTVSDRAATWVEFRRCWALLDESPDLAALRERMTRNPGNP